MGKRIPDDEKKKQKSVYFRPSDIEYIEHLIEVSETKIAFSSGVSLLVDDNKQLQEYNEKLENTIIQYDEEITKLRKQLKDQATNNSKIDEIYNIVKSMNSNVNVEKDKIDFTFERGTAGASYSMKLYPKVLESWKQFVKSNKQYKIVDLGSQAIYEFIEKYKNVKETDEKENE